MIAGSINRNPDDITGVDKVRVINVAGCSQLRVAEGVAKITAGDVPQGVTLYNSMGEYLCAKHAELPVCLGFGVGNSS